MFHGKKEQNGNLSCIIFFFFTCERLTLFASFSFFFFHQTHTEMRLLTHNLLMCNKRGCTSDHFPMKIKPTKIVVEESEFSPDEVRAMYPKLDWAALVSGAKDVCFLFLFPHCACTHYSQTLQ